MNTKVEYQCSECGVVNDSCCCDEPECDHDDVCQDERCCLDCGKDMTEELMSAAFDRAKDFRKYGE